MTEVVGRTEVPCWNEGMKERADGTTSGIAAFDCPISESGGDTVEAQEAEGRVTCVALNKSASIRREPRSLRE